MTVTARARRSQRSGPTGRPAACSAVPRPAASTATSAEAGGTEGAAGGGGEAMGKALVKGADYRGQAGLADHFLVFWVLQHGAHGLVGDVAGQLVRAEHAQRAGPADRLGDAGRLGQVELAQALDRGGDLAGEPLARPGDAAADDLRGPGAVGIGDPVVQAPALERVVQVAGPV